MTDDTRHPHGHMHRTAVAVFQHRAHAAAAVTELEKTFTADQIGMATKGEPERTPTAEATKADGGADGHDHKLGAAAGLTSGAVVGGIIGVTSTVLIPGGGLIVAAGVLANTLIGAGTGALTGGLFGALTGMGIPDEDAEFYRGHFDEGGTVVTVHAGDRFDEARTLLRGHGGIEAERREPATSVPSEE